MISSSYTKYADTNDGQNYDTSRIAIGAPVFEDTIELIKSKKDKDNKQKSVIELGCGTGNYLKLMNNLLSDSLITGIDRSKSMLA